MIGASGLLLAPSSFFQQHNSLCSFTLYTQHSHLLHNIQVLYYSSNLKYSCASYKLSIGDLQKSFRKCHAQSEDNKCDASESKLGLDVQTLKSFPAEKLDGEFVILRFESNLLLELLNIHNIFARRTLSTITYLYNAGAKVLLVGNWGSSCDTMVLSSESAAGYLSLLLQLKVVVAKTISCFREIESEKFQKADILLFENLNFFREEIVNCPTFSEQLASGANIFVNDAFFLSHKILASTVGATRFCYARLAGFHFEAQLLQLKNIREITMQPYVVIIGGGKLREKAAALLRLASVCDVLIFVGMIAFQIMHASGISVLSSFLEPDAFKEAAELIELANRRRIPIYFPTDLHCVKDGIPELFEIFPSGGLLPGWTPFDLGPMALKEINNFLSKCKAYPYEIYWATIYENPTQPLFVDIGSGNGLFPLRMAEKWKSLNFLGLEINNKLVMRCLDAIVDCKRKNVHFISTNATSTFRSIVSTYPGQLILVSIQCPNPDFNRKVNRWSMVQRSLVEAIIDLLAAEAKVFLQSDIEDVTIRMKEQFIKYGKGKIVMDEDEEGELWLAENPFGVRTDWEQHVLDRGDIMHRTMLRKARDP